MKNFKTNDEMINELLTLDEQKELYAEVEQIFNTHGGKRAGAGRKPSNGVVLKFQIRVSEKEKMFLKYAREHNLDYDSLMQG